MKKTLQSIMIVSSLTLLFCNQPTTQTIEIDAELIDSVANKIEKEYKAQQSAEEEVQDPTEDFVLEEELNDFVGEGYEILDYKYGDINNDSLADVILILKVENEDEMASNTTEMIKRPLLLLIRQNDGALRQLAGNDNVVFCSSCGGVMGDPFTGITIKGNYFSIEHYGGSSWRWTRIMTFKYSIEENYWFLHKDGGDSYHTAEPDKVETKVLTTDDFGIVRFEDYNCYDE